MIKLIMAIGCGPRRDSTKSCCLYVIISLKGGKLHFHAPILEHLFLMASNSFSPFSNLPMSANMLIIHNIHLDNICLGNITAIFKILLSS